MTAQQSQLAIWCPPQFPSRSESQSCISSIEPSPVKHNRYILAFKALVITILFITTLEVVEVGRRQKAEAEELENRLEAVVVPVSIVVRTS